MPHSNPTSLDIRPSNNEREEVVHKLQSAFTDGRLNEIEFDNRMTTVLQAQSQQELARLVADLPATGTTPSIPISSHLHKIQETGFAIMGGLERKGAWQIPEHYTVYAIMGGCLLDLRMARFSAPITNIKIFAVMGGVEIIMPPGVRVSMSGVPIMGGWSNKVSDVVLPANCPEVHITGIAIMGGVDVKMS